MNKEIIKGCIDIFILCIVKNGDTYGYKIAKEIKKISLESYIIGEGTLYSALKRLEEKKYLEFYWVSIENNRKRKYYKITKSGKYELSKRIKEWFQITKIINLLRGDFNE